MSFLNPFILFGLIAASIPVLLHLLNLRKLKTIEFSSLRFLKELQKTKIRKLKLKQIILLILRTLIIIFAVLAFARPVISGRLPFIESYSKSSVVILVDNSFSMDISDERGNRLKQSKNAVKEIIKSMKDGDEIAVIEIANLKNREQYTFSRNFDNLLETVDRISIKQSKGQLISGLKIATQLLDNATNINKELFVVSDFQKNVFENNYLDSAKIFDKEIGMYLLPVGYDSKADINNLSIDTINLQTRIFQLNKLVESDVSIRNNGKTNVSGIVVSMQFNNQKVAQRTLDIPAGEVRTVSIAANASKVSGNNATVQIESDALDLDNNGHFGFIIPETPNIAIYGNNNQRKYISTLLKSALNDEYNQKVKEFESNQLSATNLNSFDVLLILGNVAQSDFNRINQYVNNGGSVFLFANDENGQNSLAISEKLGFGSSKIKTFQSSNFGKFISLDKNHPLFEGVFLDNTNSKNVESPNISKALPSQTGQIIIPMNDGGFLSESRIGQGKVLYCATSPVLEWSNLPISSIFPVIIFRGINYLSASESMSVFETIGNTVNINIPKKFDNIEKLKIVDPNGIEFYKTPAILPSGAVLNLDELNIAGVYNIYNTQNKIISQVSVNLPKSESIIANQDKDAIMKFFKDKSMFSAKPEFVDDFTNIQKSIVRSRAGTELWQLFLILTLICAVAEMIIQKASKNEIE